MGNKVLVTGGAGFLGQALCTALRRQGYAVRSFQRSHSPALETLGIEQIRGDLSDVEAVHRACEGMDAIFHNAAKAGAWGSWQSYFDANVLGTRHVLDACRAHRIGRLVYTSTPSVAHSGRNPCEGGNEIDTPYAPAFKAHYPLSKHIAEREALAANDGQLAVVALRPRLIWGPGDNHLLPNLVKRARQGRLRFVGGGENKLDTSFIDNAAAAHLAAFDALAPGSACAGKAYFVSNGEPRAAKDIVNGLLNAVGEPPVTRSVPFALAYAAGAVCESLWTVMRRQDDPPMTRFLAEQLSTPHWYDIRAAQRDFGWRPQVGFDEGLRRLGAWWNSREARG